MAYHMRMYSFSFPDETKAKIVEQGLNQRENHNEILEDLASIRNRAHEVLSKIGQSAKISHALIQHSPDILLLCPGNYSKYQICCI